MEVTDIKTTYYLLAMISLSVVILGCGRSSPHVVNQSPEFPKVTSASGGTAPDADNEEGPVAFANVRALSGDFPLNSTIATVGPHQMDSWLTCPLNGNVSKPNDPKYIIDVKKNRYIAPPTYQPLDIGEMLQASVGNPNGLSESAGVAIKGVIAKIILEIHESHGKLTSEGCNCELTTEQTADDHLYLVPTQIDYQHFQQTGDKSSVVDVEITPRMKELARRAGFDWTTPSLQRLVGKAVVIGGWLLLDWEHKDVSKSDGAQSGVERGTTWEVHPITRIQRLP